MSHYNQQQQALIDAPFNEVVVGIAGAGTGKTTTILGRTQRFLETHPTGQLLLITFTKAAARDLKERLIHVVGEEQAKRVITGTFHAIMSKCIEENAVNVGLRKGFTILDESANAQLVKEAVDRRQDLYQPFVKHFVTHDPSLLDRLATPGPSHDEAQKEIEAYRKQERTPTIRAYRRLANALSFYVNVISPSQIGTTNIDEETLSRLSYGIANTVPFDPIYYKNLLQATLVDAQKSNVIGYDHILILGQRLATKNWFVPFGYRLVHTIVDEYQDTNALQDQFIRDIAGNNLTIVGDMDQSIYEFRGGDSYLFEQHIREGKAYHLTTNYRSFQPILDRANEGIAHNLTGSPYREPLVSHRPISEEYGGIVARSYKDSFEEARGITERIVFLVNSGIKPKDIAVLMRSRVSLHPLKGELQKQKVRIDGKRVTLPIFDMTGQTDFYHAETVQDTTNFLKLYINPDDRYAFMNALNRPKKGIGPKRLAQLEETAEKNNQSLFTFVLSQNFDELTPAIKRNLESFRTTYFTLRKMNERPRPLSAILDEIWELTGYNQWINQLKNNQTQKSHQSRLRDWADQFEEEYKTTHAQYTLFDIIQAFIHDLDNEAYEEDTDGVVLSTIHGAKGLEWDHVFLNQMTNMNFPWPKADTERELEGERRLMYVAATRAKNSLWVTWSKKGGFDGKTPVEPSIYIKEGGYQ